MNECMDCADVIDPTLVAVGGNEEGCKVGSAGERKRMG